MEEQVCKHCGGSIPYFTSDVCMRPHCYKTFKKHEKFVRIHKDMSIQDILIGSKWMGITIDVVSRLLDIDIDILETEMDILRQDSR